MKKTMKKTIVVGGTGLTLAGAAIGGYYIMTRSTLRTLTKETAELITDAITTVASDVPTEQRNAVNRAIIVAADDIINEKDLHIFRRLLRKNLMMEIYPEVVELLCAAARKAIAEHANGNQELINTVNVFVNFAYEAVSE